MKKQSVLLILFGVIIILFGTLSFIFAYPYNESANSGPSNVWELLLIISYEGKGWYLCTGFLVLTLSFFKLKNGQNE